jgi:hypothetical protein
VPLVLSCFLLFSPALLFAEEPIPSLEYQVKASMIYNFLQFISWSPESLPPSADIAVCIVAPDKFGAAIDELANELVQGRRLTVRRMSALDEIEQCRVIFVDAEETARFAPVFAEMQARSILTIGESEDFLSKGGVINFLTENGKLRFEINHRAALDSRIQISSKLLRLAIHVLEVPQ